MSNIKSYGYGFSLRGCTPAQNTIRQGSREEALKKAQHSVIAKMRAQYPGQPIIMKEILISHDGEVI